MKTGTTGTAGFRAPEAIVPDDQVAKYAHPVLVRRESDLY